MPKYRILEFVNRLKDPVMRVSILGAIVWKLNISRATFYRYMKLDHSSVDGFDPDDLDTIVKIFNERVIILGRELKREDLLNPGENESTSHI